ncbi:MAG: glycosyltransferase family 39 protein, partial [bacterium]
MVLLAAIALFVVQGWIYAGAQFSWHEEIATHAVPAPLQLIIDHGVARVVDACASGDWIAYTGPRPQVVLCAGGLAWPIMVTPYIGGPPYWPLQLLRPLHHGDPIAMRRAALLFGVLALWILFRLVERVGNPTYAAAVVAVAAVQPAFIAIHSLLVLFEPVPPLLIAGAALLIANRPDPSRPPTAGRAAAAGALAGLAVLANVKGAVVGLPILAFALFESASLRRTSGRAWLAAAVAALIMLAPMIVFGLADPQGRFSHEVSRRLAIAAARLDPRLLLAEVFNSFIFAADFGFYFDLAIGGDGGLRPPLLLVAAFAFANSVFAFGRALLRKTHDPVAAACGGLQLFYVLFVCLAYNQTPGGNYSPIIYAQAVSMGCAIIAVGRAAARRAGRPRLGIA